MVALLATVTPSRAQVSAQDTDLSVDPVVRFFPVTAVGTDSAAAEFRVTNSNATETRVLGTLAFSGTNAGEFVLANDTCSGATLAANGGSCTVGVRFHPTSRGTKAANLLIPSNDLETPTLAAFVSNYEATASEAMRRMPPVLTVLSLPPTMIPGDDYTIAWSLEGYHDSYMSSVVLFDCTGITADCGANYGDSTRLIASGNLEAVSTEDGSWQFGGVSTRRFNYSWSFRAPDTRNGGGAWNSGGTDIVVRFYCKDDIDDLRNRGNVSLMVPGGVAAEYYDTTGRRILTEIKP